MSESRRYGLVEPFDIDNGELDGLTPQEVFTLGVEWQMFLQDLEAYVEVAKTSDVPPMTKQIHTANANRLKAMCARKGLKVTEHWVHEDHPDWRLLKVGPPLP